MLQLILVGENETNEDLQPYIYERAAQMAWLVAQMQNGRNGCLTLPLQPSSSVPSLVIVCGQCLSKRCIATTILFPGVHMYHKQLVDHLYY